jgi:signal peptidase I
MSVVTSSARSASQWIAVTLSGLLIVALSFCVVGGWLKKLPVFTMESWAWKCAFVGALLAARVFVQTLTTLQLTGSNSQASHEPNSVVEALDSIALAIGLVLFVVQPFVLQAFWIPTGSMENTLLGATSPNGRGGDRLLVSKFVYNFREPHPGDVIVFQAPPQADAGTEGDDFIKRCIGTPGDVVEIRARTLYRNGKIVPQPFVKWSNPNSSYDLKIVDGKVYSREFNPNSGLSRTPIWIVEGHANEPREAAPDQEYISRARPEAVPQGKYLMLGDHRDNSSDGHVWGFVPRENIVGKAFCVFWPLNRIGTVDRMSQGQYPLVSSVVPGTASFVKS